MSLGALEVEALAERLRRHEPSVTTDPAAIQVVRAPGRVNLIGEHTDYNLGFVLPAAIGLEIRLAFVPTSDRHVAITLPDGERREFALDAIPPRSGGWIDYVAATAWSLQSAGLPLHGFRGVLASDLPMSAGLSSSAALELASAFALLDPSNLATHGIDGMQVARLCQRGENDHVGVQCGIMDQAAVALGRPGRALLIDCRSLEVRAVALPTTKHVLVVCDTNAPRRLEASEYNVRRAECEAAVAAIAAVEPGVESLRDVDAEMLARHAPRLKPVELARAEHVVGENTRVLRTVEALETDNLVAVGRLFAESHASLRDRYEVSSPELDAMVEIATATPGVMAARMTGAGFGGCTVNLVRRDAVATFREAVEREYPERTGRQPTVFAVEPVAGVGPVVSNSTDR